MSMIQPKYLMCTEGNSDKFYIIVPLPGNTEALTGYGSRAPNTKGTWSKRALSYAHSKEREKIREGYIGARTSDIPRPALAQMLSEIQRAIGSAVSLDSSGNIVIGASGSPSPAAASAPRRPKSGDRVKVWL